MTWLDEWTATAIASAVRSRAARPEEPAAEALRRIADRDGAHVALTPALAQDPPPAVPRSRSGWVANVAADVRFSPYTSIWNVLRWPAMTVPAGVDRVDGLPVAVQLAAPPGGEAVLLDLAARIEHHAPWPRTATAK